MLHIEWIMSERNELKSLREALGQAIRNNLGNGFSFTENHLVLVLDLGQIYSYREMQNALRIFEATRVANCINGFITNVEFKN